MPVCLLVKVSFGEALEEKNQLTPPHLRCIFKGSNKAQAMSILFSFRGLLSPH